VTSSVKWIIAESADPKLAQQIGAELKLPAVFASLLCRRGMACASDASAFLSPRLKALTDPLLIPNMRSAVERILAALDRKESIVLFGDYDVDGVTSITLLTRMLRAYGADPKPFVPLRAEEGYGLTAEAAKRCVSQFQPKLIIALDCGTASINEIAALRADGIDVVVVDHHEAKGSLPECTAVVNPKAFQAGEPFRYFCTAGLVFKLCHALLKSRPLGGFDLREYLDIVALGTVADIVPLVDENRILVQKGLEQMARTKWIGIKTLIEVAGVTTPITPTDVGFQIGPRLNASGRLASAEESLELLLTQDAGKARSLALKLDSINRDRQRVEQQTLREAEAQLASIQQTDAAIIVGAPGWHPGVLGIVASRICKAYHRPTIVVGFDETGTGKGSGRSIDGFSIVHALTQCGHLLERFGGHEMAAGITVHQENFEEFHETFCSFARQNLTDDDLMPRITLDGELSLADVDMKFLQLHEALQPFGIGNSQPLFFARGVRPLSEPQILKEKHLRLVLGQNGARQEAMFFNAAENPLPRPPWDIAFKVERNEWRDRVRVQILLQHVRSSQ
jgi:single-stranded-DNA-specific exonuclease